MTLFVVYFPWKLNESIGLGYQCQVAALEFKLTLKGNSEFICAVKHNILIVE